MTHIARVDQLKQSRDAEDNPHRRPGWMDGKRLKPKFAVFSGNNFVRTPAKTIFRTRRSVRR